MDFIERIFHVSPDNGDGTLETAFLVLSATCIVLIAVGRHISHLSRRNMASSSPPPVAVQDSNVSG